MRKCRGNARREGKRKRREEKAEGSIRGRTGGMVGGGEQERGQEGEGDGRKGRRKDNYMACIHALNSIFINCLMKLGSFVLFSVLCDHGLAFTLCLCVLDLYICRFPTLTFSI